MARGSTALATAPRSCSNHRPYRTKYEATAKASWHPVGACDKCRRGGIWRVWQHDQHWHIGHGQRDL